ncbi:MAG: SDR family oxidoreductase [Acidobacteriota bacterium]
MAIDPTVRTAGASAALARPPAARSLAIISGAAAGIGLAVLRRFLADGWECVALDIDAAALGRIAAEKHRHLHAIVSDLVLDDAIVADHLGALDDSSYQQVTLVNNVGGSRQRQVGLAELPWDDAAATLAFNLKPMLRLTQLAFPLLRSAKSGRIVNVSSAAGRTGGLDVAPDYAAAKGALVAWSRQLVGELASDNVLINTICPGIIGTDRILNGWRRRSTATNAGVMARIPLGRLGTPAEIAEVIYFLGSATNTYMTGAIVDVNGGFFSP